MQAIQKVFNLINKTGDRCIVLSEQQDDAYVIMSLQEYERMTIGRSAVTDLTEEELLDRINRDIAVWKSQQETDDAEVEQEAPVDNQQFIGSGAEHDTLANKSENFPYNRYWEQPDFEEDEEQYYFEQV